MAKLSPSGSETTTKPEGEPADVIQRLHERLEEHFLSLRAERQETAGGKPVFALEHGLTRDEVAQLQTDVRHALKSGPPARMWWLPLVVYAAELGYRYDADEYWQTFESETPGWTQHGDRYYIRDRFKEFARRFGGAKPTGIWANHFSIICWPITHAVLPKDLQFHLARVLFESRYLLTPELLERPDELGKKLASRAYGTSSRFENFAQNTSLLGQVAVALLLEKEGKSPLLLSSTLTRITADLFAERQARRWLTDAKTSANRVNLRGLARPAGGAAGDTGHAQDASPRLGAPTLTLRREDGPWKAYLELPDLSLLGVRFPGVQHALASSRSRLAGVKGALARGRVLYRGQRIRLDDWPGSDPKLLRLENGDSQLEAILADEVRFSPGPVWIFLLADENSAEEIRGKTVRPDREYVMLTRALDRALPAWIEPVAIECGGIQAYRLRVPSPIGANDEALLRGLGLPVVSNIEVRPVGLVPAAWDGEGHAEWVAGDHPLIAISSSREVQACRIALDGNPPLRLDWPSGTATGPLYLSLGALDVGVHEVRVVLVSKGMELLAEGTLTAAVREPNPRSSAGSYREALLLLTTPALPTLGELWDGKATVEILGPGGLTIGVRAWLERSPGSALVTKQFRPLQLPVDANTWNQVFDKEFRQLNDVTKQFDSATALVVEVSHPDLGSTSLRAEREFAPLRWGVGRDRDGPYIRLHDNVGDKGLIVEEFDYSHPDVDKWVPAEPESKIRSDAGGLFRARLGEFSAAVVLPPNVRNFSDMSRAQIRPVVTGGPRTADTVLRWMQFAAMWARASLPGDPFAQILRASVLRSFAIATCSVIGGPRWAAYERRIEDGDRTPLRQLAEAVGDNPYQAIVVTEVRRKAAEFPELFIDERIDEFARIIRRIDPTARPPVDWDWMSEFLLRLASSPNVALTWGRGNTGAGIDLSMRLPMMLRAARYIVLAMSFAFEGPGVGSPYGGWTWL